MTYSGSLPPRLYREAHEALGWATEEIAKVKNIRLSGDDVAAIATAAIADLSPGELSQFLKQRPPGLDLAHASINYHLDVLATVCIAIRFDRACGAPGPFDPATAAAYVKRAKAVLKKCTPRNDQPQAFWTWPDEDKAVAICLKRLHRTRKTGFDLPCDRVTLTLNALFAGGASTSGNGAP